MFNRVCFLVLILGALAAEEERIAHFEGSPSGIAAGWVNVISGSIVHQETDLIIPGIEPLQISRSPLYAPGYFPKDKVKESWNFSFKETLQRQMDNGRENLVVHQGSQELLSFKNGDPHNPEKRFFKSSDHPRGYTNQAAGPRPTGQTALKNYWVNRGSPHWMTLTSGSGEVRDYQGNPAQSSKKDVWLPLKEVIKPNGFRYFIGYDRNNEKQGVTLKTPSGREVAFYLADDKGDALSITSFDDRSVQYQFQKMGGRNGSTFRFLKGVERSDSPSVQYEYVTDDLQNGQLKKIQYPEDRAISFQYWNSNSEKNNRSSLKVKTLYQPAGTNSTPIATHTFAYYTKDKERSGWTDVIDFEGNKDVYLFDADYRLREVRNYKGLSEKHFVETFFWDKEGQLTLSALSDGHDNPLRAKSYGYSDKRGNATEEREFGNLTGEGKALPQIDHNGHFNQSGLESYGSYFDYSNDKNLLVKERHENGITILCSYKEGTNLVAEKKTFAHEFCVKSETFTYDGEHRLIETTEDDGERKTIVRLAPLERPFGYPQEKKIIGWSQETGEVFLESYHYTYNVRGDITSEEKRDSQGRSVYKIERTYDGHGNCTQEKNAVGDIIRRLFDLNDNCIREEGPRVGLVKTFSYDWMNRCTQETVTYLGEVTKRDHAYNKRGNRTSTVDPFGQITRFTVDRFGNQVRIELPPVLVDGIEKIPVIQQSFDHFGNVLTATDPLGYTTQKKYTSRNKPCFIEHPDGTSEHFLYTRDGHLSQTIDQEEVKTRYHWDPLGRLQAKETPFGIEYFHYKGMLLERSFDLAGVETHYKYDPFGRLTETRCGNRKETIVYDVYGYPGRKSYYEEDRLLKTDVTCYDALKRVVETYVEDPTGAIFCPKRFEYDGAGNCIVEWDDAAKTVKTYDGENRVVKLVDPLGNVYQIDYRKGSVLEKTVIDPLGQKVVTLYNTHGKEAKISHFDNFGIELSSKTLFYNLAGHLEKEETKADGVLQTLLYQRDSMGRVIALIEPLRKITTSKYTSGKLAVLTKPDGVQLLHTYDRGRLASLKSSDGKLAYTYSYSPRGELLEVLDELTGFCSRQAFSIHGDLVEEALPTGQTINYQHDGLGRIISYRLPDGGEVAMEHNAIVATSITRYDQKKNLLYTHAYTSFNQRGDVEEQQLIGTAGKINCTFDEMYQLKGAVHPRYKQEELMYDAVGNLLSYRLNGESYRFSYDSLYQLTEEKGHSYSFDALHNRRSKDEDLYQLNELNQLTAAGAYHYTYDPNGNLIQADNGHETLRFGYDPLNRLIFIQKGEHQVHFKYDPFNRRISQNGKPFYFFGHQEIGDERSLRILGLGLGADVGAAVALELDGQIYAPLHDHNGSITALLDLEGNLVEEWSYTAFGEQIGTTSSPWTFSSKRHNPLTGWLSFGRRDYDPETGRWTTPDPLGFADGPNLYAYVSNRPLTHRDPLGLFEIPSVQGPPYITEWVPQNHNGSFPQVRFFQDFEAMAGQYQGNGERSSIFSVGHVEVPNRGVGFMPGILNDKKGTSESSNYISTLIGGVKLDVYHNSTHGVGLDLAECDFGKKNIATTPVQLLHRGWSDFFAKNPNGYYLMYCHSQGAIHVMNALITFDRELAKRIQVVAIAPGAYIYEQSCGSVVHYRAKSSLRDPIAHGSDKPGAIREAETIREVASHWDAPYLDHTILSPTYKRPIQIEARKFFGNRW